MFLSPTVASRWAPELQWTIETLLTGLGRTWWLTTDPAADVDVAYATADEAAPEAAVQLRADAAAWSELKVGAPRRLSGHLAGIDEQGDVFADCFSLASGNEEQSWARDKHGHHFPPTAEDGRLFADALVSCVAGVLDKRFGRAAPSPWPEEKTFAAIATHDVDYPQVVRWLEPLRVTRRAGTRMRAAAGVLTGRLHHWHFDSWTADESELGMRSAFFFVARQGSLLQFARGTPDPFYDVGSPRFRLLLRELVARGFEVGLQASYGAWERPGQLAHEKAVLEEAAGVDVVGGRHHYWRLNPDQPDETLLAHEEAGLQYDCSLAFERLAGWRRGLSWPFHPFHRRLRRPVETLQLPTAWMDDQVFGHAGHNDVSGSEARDSLLTKIVEGAARTRGVLVTDIHEYVYDEQLFPGWRSTYERVWHALASRSDVWIAPPAEVTRHWNRHERSLRAASRGLT
jgi:hypothetical protein